MPKSRKVAFAIVAHPDDIEFMMAGTLILLGQAGFELHYMNIANGSCGTAVHTRADIIRVRAGEAKAACKLIGATHHRSLADDVQVFYEKKLLAQVGAVMRDVNPSILLVPSPQDYMEDHVIAGRLAVTAAFCRGMRNFTTSPRRKPVADEVTVYHALPYGLHDGMRQQVGAGLFVNIDSVLAEKRRMLACHKSQKEWLDVSQGLDAYLTTMEKMSAEVGRMSGKFKFAEGWRRHSHLGFSGEDVDPLRQVLGRRTLVNKAYERALAKG